MKAFPSHARRILMYMFIVGMLPVMLLSLENYISSKKAVEDSEQGHLSYALKSRLTFLEAWLHHTKKEFFFAAQSSCTIRDCAGDVEDELQKNPTCKALQTVMRGHATYLSLAVYDEDWSVMVTTTEAKDVEIVPPSEDLKRLFSSSKGFITGQVMFANDRAIMPICHPTMDDKGKPVAYTVGYLDLKQSLNRILGKSSDIGETGKYFLLDKDGTYLWSPEGEQELIGTKAKVPAVLYEGNYKKVVHYQDDSGRKLLGISAPIEKILPWSLLAQIEEHEAYEVLNKRMLVSLLTAIITISCIVFICIRLSNHLSTPLRALARVAQNISSGNVKERAPEFSELETKEVGDAFNTMLDSLAASQRALSRAASLAAIGELSSSIVHEMRNPLSSMKINLRSLVDKFKDDPVYTEIVAISIQQSARLETMLVDVMNYGSPLELNLEPTTFAEIVENVLPLFSEEVKGKQISLRCDDNLKDKTIVVDMELMIRALTNLVANGIQWSPEGGEVLISGNMAPGEDDWVSMRVRDGGSGIRKNQRESLFKLFYSTRKSGHGIGLANVKKIIGYHGGFVAGDNAKEGGAVFSILLPSGGPES